MRASDAALRAERLQVAFDLHEAGKEMMRLKLRRENPAATDTLIDELLGRWLAERPGAEHGDAEGRPCGWPRRRE